MDALPTPVLDYLQHMFAQTRSPAFFLVDKQGCLLDWGGALSTFGLADLPKGAPIIDYLPFLTGLLPAGDVPAVYPCVEIDAGLFIDLHLFAAERGDWVVLLNASAEEGQHRHLQQRVHALSLLLEKQFKVLRQHLVIDVFQHLDEFLCGGLRDAALLADVCAALDILVLERPRSGACRIVGSLPAWFTALSTAASRGHGTVRPGRLFPFLANFLIDAEEFWRKDEVGVLKSGPWRALDRRGNEVYLEASAVRWGACQFLLIAHPQMEFEETQAIIQKARENALQQHRVQKEIQHKEILLHGIVHDLGSPLMPMMACFSFLQNEPLGPKARKFVALGLQQVTWQQMLIQEILDTFRTEFGDLNACVADSLQAPDVVECTRAVVELLSPLVAAKRITLQVLPAPKVGGAWGVVGERSHLERVILNLVENAVRHAPEGSVIPIKVRHDGPSVLLTVDDRGSGVPPDLVGRLFEKFSWGGTRRGRAGLGLYFCRMTIERWGGTIGYTPRPKGGSRFWLRLPSRI